jgi:acyl-CoA thioesterase-1
MGDSISASHGIEVQQGWATLLQQRLDEKNLPFSVKNESISGETTAGGLARIDRALEQHKPTIVLIELGANDGLRGLSPFVMKKNLAKMIHRSEQAGAKVLLLGMKIPPNYGKRYVETFFDVYRQLAEEYEVQRVPFLMEGVALDKKLMQRDRLHPNALAQPFILENIWPYLSPNLSDN